MKPLLLLILDGWGDLDSQDFNAIALAKTPQWDKWRHEYPYAKLEASGLAVGLPENQIGNSEVGHMHIGAGRVIFQDLCRINQAIDDKSFFTNPILSDLCQDTLKRQATLHIMGLFSQGGVHSHQNHLFALIKLCQQHGNPQVALHLFLDGRDTAPQSALESIRLLEEQIKDTHHIRIASICGRFYAMDRDQRFERVKEAYELLTQGYQTHFPTAQMAIENAYAHQITDEFIPPSVIGTKAQVIKDGDNVFFFNFRADRAIQLCDSLISPDFIGFERQVYPKIQELLTMVPYSEHLKLRTAFTPQILHQTLGEIFSQHHLRQLRIAETEKFPHVTYFFNGGRETIFPLEERLLIPSPKVKTYNLMPEMRAMELTDMIVEALNEHSYDIIIANFANADMVGHCGEMQATIEAIETLDRCFTKLDTALKNADASAIITADHGNAEVMFDSITKQKHTAHTLSPVPFLYIGKNCQLTQNHGSLIDIAPTILYLLNIEQPKEMTGSTLLKRIAYE